MEDFFIFHFMFYVVLGILIKVFICNTQRAQHSLLNVKILCFESSQNMTRQYIKFHGFVQIQAPLNFLISESYRNVL